MALVYPTTQQDELTALFSRNMTLDQTAPVPVPVQVPVQEAPREEPKIVYISQHYTHSAHVIRKETQPPVQPARAVSEPPQPEHFVVEKVLREHGVDPSCLSQAQLSLFKMVEDPQKLHLIELWRAAPPTNSIDNPTLAWSMTSVNQEEILAKARWEQQQAAAAEQQLQQEMQHETVMSLDGTPLTPTQSENGRWVNMVDSYSGYMEPYMQSGYEQMARREYEHSAREAQAEAYAPSKEMPLSAAPVGPTFNPAHSDPVYNRSSNVEWRRQEAMADQYGRMAGFGY